MSLNIGMNVKEVDGRAAPSIQAAPTSVAAFIIRAPKGVPGRVDRVTNWTQFTDRFGGHIVGAYGAYAVRGFFDNGGSVGYITRIVGDNDQVKPVSASWTFNDSAVEPSPSLTITAGYRAQENPGTWANDVLSIRIESQLPEGASEETPEKDKTYKLEVRYRGTTVEVWEQLNHSTEPDAAGQHPIHSINDELTGSSYIIVSEDATVNPAATDGTPDADENGFVTLLGGKNDKLGHDDNLTDKENEAALGTAAAGVLSYFDIYQVQLVCCPETTHKKWVADALTYCAGRGDCTFVGHTPESWDFENAKSYGEDHRGTKMYGALYFPWIMVSDPAGNPLWIPPTGHVLGVYARTERERGIWKAPAGNAARVNGALDVKYQITDVDHDDLVKNGSINAIRFIPGQGIVIDSSRSLSTSPLWLYVNIRLLFNFVKSSLMAGLRWVVQEPNDDTLWNKVKYNSVTPFLMGLWRRGAFGPGSPDEVFTVKCDAENNPPANIQQGIFTVEVYFYPSRPAETIVITVGQQEGGASASEG